MNPSKSEIKLVVTCDLGASLTKAIAQVYPEGIPRTLTINPEVADAEKESVLKLDNSFIKEPWIKIKNEYYVLGSVAKTMFAGTAAINSPKGEYALPKIAGILWLACDQLDLKKASLWLYLLLPPSELGDGASLGEKLDESLKEGISTPTGNLKLRLRHFQPSIEGSGVISHHHRFLGNRFEHKKIGVLMIGYRNASFTLFQYGSKSKSETTELGMNWIVEKFIELSQVGLTRTDLQVTKVLTQVYEGNFSSLRTLSRKAKGKEIDRDVELFQNCSATARKEYCRVLFRWLRDIKNIGTIDEIIISGGTATIIREELNNYFREVGISVVWDGGVEIPSPLDTQKLGRRLADVWSTHITYVKMIDNTFGYERTGPLVPNLRI